VSARAFGLGFDGARSYTSAKMSVVAPAFARRGYGEASMINKLLELSLRNRVLVVAAYIGLGLWGWWAVSATPIDAIPDLSDNQVIVFTDWPGHSPQEVETKSPIRSPVNLQGLAGVRVVRSQSAFGLLNDLRHL
jgi:hypothetical protein